MSVLEVRDLNVWFELPAHRELHAVRGVDLSIEAGEVFGLVGESGCGKSTTILSLMGLLPPSASVSGEVRIDGRNTFAAGERSTRQHRWIDIAMVFQGAMNAFNPVKTILWQIVEPMLVHTDTTKRQARSRAQDLLGMVGISPSAGDRYPHEFSGGMRQRAAIAMALACDPKVVLADEPTTALDVMVQAQILELLSTLASDLGLAVVLVTHDLPIVAQICQRAAVMYAGEIVESGRVDDLYYVPGHPYTRLLFAATPDVRGEEQLRSIPGVPPRLDEKIIGCPFAPRCGSTVDRCTVEAPSLLTLGAAHVAACHLSEKAAQ